MYSSFEKKKEWRKIHREAHIDSHSTRTVIVYISPLQQQAQYSRRLDSMTPRKYELYANYTHTHTHAHTYRRMDG